LTTDGTTSTDKRNTKYLTVVVQSLPHAGGDKSARRAATPYLFPRYLLFKSSSSFRVRSRDSRLKNLPHARGDNWARRAATPYLFPRYLLFKSSSSFRVHPRDSRFDLFPSKIKIQQSSLDNPFLTPVATSGRGEPPRPTNSNFRVRACLRHPPAMNDRKKFVNRLSCLRHLAHQTFRIQYSKSLPVRSVP